MCTKTCPPRDDEKISSFVNVRRSKRKRKKVSSSLNYPSYRKTRTKTRKPKYLSLKLELNSSSSSQSNKMTQQQEENQKHHLNLFPLHPENLVDQDKSDNYQYDTVAAYLFNDSTTETTISTINDLLDNNTTTTSEEGPLSPPSSSTYGSYGDHLVRTAMRCYKEREASEEERWVCYSEVMNSSNNTTSTRCGGGAAKGDAYADRAVEGKRLSLALKLDYQQILNAWSDKGPLYIDGESPQTVPDLHAGGANLLMDGWDNVENVWRVPEMASNVGDGFKLGEEMDAKENWKKGRREASVLRYKEKRQSRLFSKRIRYEVRKLNAQKRPRMKGRFVKIS